MSAEPAPPAPAGDAWRLAGLLVATGWGTNHFVPLLLVYRAQDRLGPSVLAGLFGIYALGLLPGLLLSGPASDRRGRRRLVLPGAGVLLASSGVLAAGSESLPLLYVGRLLTGVGAGVLITVGSAWLADTLARSASGPDPSRSARWTGLALTTGFGGGPLVAGLLAQWLPAPQIAPYLLHIALLALAVAAARRVPDTALGPGTASRLTPRVPVGARRRFRTQLLPLAPWVFTLPSIAFVTVPGLVTTAATTTAVAYTGLVAGVAAVCGAGVQPLARRIPPRAAPAMAVAVGALGLVAATVAVAAPRWGAMAVALLAGAALGAAYGLALNAGLRTVEDITAPADRGALTGLFYVLAYLGFVAPLLLTEVTTATGSPTAALGLAAATAVLTSVWLVGTAPRATRGPARR